MEITKIHKTLANNQVATVFLSKKKHNSMAYIEVSFCIGASRRANKYWFNDKPNYRCVKSTGQCGLEGLLFCKSVIMQLAGHNVLINWMDDKRCHAYKKLTEIGFKCRHFKDTPDEDFYFIMSSEW